MKRLLSLSFSFCFLPLFAFSQTTFTGVIKNKQGELLIVNVMLQAKGNNTIDGFTTSDAEGKYSLTYKGTADTITLTVSGIMAGKHQQTVPNRSRQVNFTIEETTMELKEVTIVADPIRRTGDTLSYTVSAYSDQNDRVIGDALRKMPGIEVASSGQISYNGKNINKFYVEDLDMLQGRYGIAINNISVKDVASVQVLENHQPIKALRDKIFSENAAINLKLKNSAKGILTLSALVGMGYKPRMWDAELVAMYFTGKKQNMSSYKGNNSGKNISSEIQSHYDYERVGINNSNLLSISSPSMPPVAQKRYLYNTTNSITTNQLFKINQDLELTANAFYYNDYIKKEGYSITEQFMPGDSFLRIEEQVKSTSKINNLEIALGLNANTDSYFLNNSLNFKRAWDNDRGSGITRSNAGNLDETMLQYLDKSALSVDNTLNLVKNIKDNTVKIYFSVAYGHQPHSLTITPANYFGNENLTSLKQNVLSKNFASTLRGSYGLKRGNFNMDYDLWGSVDIRNMNTELTGKDTQENTVFSADSLKNDLGYNNYRFGLNQSYSYIGNRKFKATFALPVANYSLTVDDRIPDTFIRHNRWMLNPSLSASYNLTHQLTALAGANFRKTFGNMNDIYTGYIMHSYRNLVRNTIDRLFETRSGGTNASLEYRDAFQSFFLNINGSYGKSWKNLLYGYDYQGIMRVKTTIDQPTKSDNYGLGFTTSKGFRFWKTTLRLSGRYNENRGEQLIQNEILNFCAQTYQTSASVNVSPISLMYLQYDFGWIQSRSLVEKLPGRFPSIRNNSQAIKINLYPFKSVTVNMNVDYRHNSAVSNRNTTFVDAGIKYNHKQMEWELQCNNLLNVKQYVSMSYSDISTYSYSYDLRPASVLLNVRFNIGRDPRY
ncbi:hypothetical protein FACS189426_12470 [Bacteroidia bacterium]|nr:hypothetical protein FACS189426_12470 [Bacteroidia bacterium]